MKRIVLRILRESNGRRAGLAAVLLGVLPVVAVQAAEAPPAIEPVGVLRTGIRVESLAPPSE